MKLFYKKSLNIPKYNDQIKGKRTKGQLKINKRLPIAKDRAPRTPLISIF